jgi:hypothetical protein
MRYNNVIKRQLKDIERVKEIILNEKQGFCEDRLRAVKLKLNEYLRDAGLERKDIGSIARRHKRECDVLSTRIDQAKHFFDITCLENQVELLTRCHKLIGKATATKAKIPDKTRSEMKEIVSSISILSYLKKERIIGCNVERELRDIELEITRQNVRIEVYSLFTDLEIGRILLASFHRNVLNTITSTLSQASKIEKSELDLHIKDIEEARSKYPISPPTREERDQIVKAMGLAKGHWFQCRQGHIYAIGECGGAMERGTCPECKDVIGGASHRPEGGNEEAQEIYGSRYTRKPRQ